ncbi:MAG: M48 family metalloprotease [Alphaproteobacteria bacterium]|nr:M48 family metalloprotease [Alphaproteobacteria bacterium]
MKRALLLPILAGACNGDVNLFTIQDDVDLGMQVRDEILATPEEYNVVPEEAAPAAYGHLRRIRDAVLGSGKVEHADDFEWEVYLIDDDETLNAFCTPGGYMFFYSGLMRYLDEEDHFAGVMGHEMAHAASRHSTEQLTQAYGVQTLIELALGEGDAATIATVAAGVATLEFSRTDEAESDAKSVEYLCETDYSAAGASGFFEKLLAEGGGQIPEFLSSHPSNASRVEDITAHAEELGCSIELDPNADWAAVQASLP